MNAHRTIVPEEKDFVMGEIKETGNAFFGSDAALVHADIGTGYPDRDAITLEWLPNMVAAMLQAGGFAVSGLPLQHTELQELPKLPTVEEGRYFVYQKI